MNTSHKSRLTSDSRMSMLALYAQGVKQTELAARFGITQGQVSRILGVLLGRRRTTAVRRDGPRHATPLEAAEVLASRLATGEAGSTV